MAAMMAVSGIGMAVLFYAMTMMGLPREQEISFQELKTRLLPQVGGGVSWGMAWRGRGRQVCT